MSAPIRPLIASTFRVTLRNYAAKARSNPSQYYAGPGGVHRLSHTGRIDVYSRKTRKWEVLRNSSLAEMQRFFAQDCTPISERDLAPIFKKLSERSSSS